MARNTKPSTSKKKNKKEIATRGKVEKTPTTTAVRPYVLDVVKALADEIKLTRNLEKEDESKKEIIEIDLSDTESVEVITPVAPKLQNKKARKSCRNNEAEESFITIDETSFFQQSEDVINIAEEATPSPCPRRNVTRKRKTSRSAPIISITLNDTPAGPSSGRTVTLKDTLLALKPAYKNSLAHLKNATNVPEVSALSPLVKVRSRGRYFEDKSPARQAAGRITKKQKRKLLQANKNTPVGKGRRKKKKSLTQNLDVQKTDSNSGQECFWGPGVGSNPGVKNQFENNVQNLQLREIVVDGQNVARGHCKNGFSPQGIRLVVDYFKIRGHKVVVFLPNSCMGLDKNNVLKRMENENILIYTPSRKVDGKLLQPYDDRYIIEYASDVGGVVISRDQYRDLIEENPRFKHTIVNRLLMYTFVGDMLMFPPDPLGKSGPSLDQLLHFEPGEVSPQTSRANACGPVNVPPFPPPIMQGMPIPLLQPPQHLLQPPQPLLQPPQHVLQPPQPLLQPPPHVLQPPQPLLQPPQHILQPPQYVSQPSYVDILAREEQEAQLPHTVTSTSELERTVPYMQ